jgi:pimeloyl-ACP methyl ester carboxylesterase
VSPVSPLVPGIHHRHLESFDGTRLAYQVRGPEDAPCVVLCNGLGGTHEAFLHLYEALGDRYRILCWDYRGLFGSATPKDRKTLAIPSHCRDLVRLLEHERVDRAVFVGWSMGVQVCFELARHHRERMVGIMAINGTYGSPFRSALASRLTRHVVPAWLGIMKRHAPTVSRTAQAAVAWRPFLLALSRLGLVGDANRIAPGILEAAMERFATVDFSVFSDILRQLGEHDARDVLPTLSMPTLIVTGDRDLLTPAFTARRLNRWITGSRLVIIPGGTHYTPIEHPQVIQREAVAFLEGLGWSKTARRQVA